GCMPRDFLPPKEGGALTRPFCAKLEAEEAKRAPQGLSRFLKSRKTPARKPLDAPGFIEDGGRLSVEGVEVFERDPVNLLRLFHIADRRDLDLHPDAFTAVTRTLHLINPRV